MFKSFKELVNETIQDLCQNCSGKEITSLEGCPKEVDDFYFNNNYLTTLEGGPEKVKGVFDCSNNKLTTLKGSPKICNHFYCSYNKLTTLEGGPTKINDGFDCSHNQLTTLKGCPEYVDCIFDCSENPNLEDISDLPSMVYNLYIDKCPNIKIFTKEITNDDGILSIITSSKRTRKKIKSWSYYEVVEENEKRIKVKIKTKGQQVIDNI